MTPTPKRWFDIQNKAATKGGTAEVYIFDEVSLFGVSAKDFVAELGGLGDVDGIDVHLNSPGGDVFDAIAIMNGLKAHPATVRVIIDGLAASSASFIAMAGDEVVMAPHSEMMIHEAWGLVMGDATEMHRTAELLDKTSDNIAAIYHGRAGGSLAEWRDAMRAETWFSADEAVAAGLADRVGHAEAKGDTADAEVTEAEAEALAAKARFDLSIFNHAGRAQAPPPTRLLKQSAQNPAPIPGRAGTNPPPTERGAAMSDSLISGLRERLGISADAELDEAGLLAALDEALAKPEDDPKDTAGTLPQGVVTVDEALLADLREKAELGVAARAQQIAEQRNAVVESAIRTGRIPPARRNHWIEQLIADPGAAEVLNGLSPGTMPLSPVGYSGGIDESSDDDRLYAKLFGKDA